MGTAECGERRQLEGAGPRVEPDDGHEQQRGRHKRIDEVLDGRLATILCAPEGGDQDRHRNQRQLPEAVVEKEIERDEDAQHRDLLEQEQNVKRFAARGDRVPAGEDAERGEEAGENDQPHAEAVDAKVIADRGRGDPGVIRHKTKAVLHLRRRIARRQMKSHAEGHERDHERGARLQLASIREQRKHKRADERGEDDEAQDVRIEIHRCVLFLFRLQMCQQPSAEDHHGHHRGGTKGEPPGVGTKVARLHAPCELAEVDRDPRGELARAVDGNPVADAEEEDAREAKQPGDEDGMEDLVDVELVRDQRVRRGKAVGERSGCARPAQVEEVGKSGAGQRSQEGDDRKDRLGRLRVGTRRETLTGERERLKHGLEEAPERVAAAPRRWNPDPSTDD